LNIQIWQAGKLPKELNQIIYRFICRRFNDEWSIDRTDISYEIINVRENIVLFDEQSVIGYLGIEADGELVNGSIEKGLMGVKRLQSLIELAVKKKNNRTFYAFVPIDKTGSAVACFLAGMLVQEPIITKVVNYNKKNIVLIKLTFSLKIEDAVSNFKSHVKQQLKKLNEINSSLCQ